MATGVPQEPEPQAPAISHHIGTILYYLQNYRIVVVSAAPGSGKSTVLPRYLANYGFGPVICAQPRLFAVTVASSKPGQERESDDVWFTTTRVLIDMLCCDRPAFAAAFRTIVVDEAHDRTLCTDLLLGVVKAAVATEEMGHLNVVVCTAGGPEDSSLSDFFFGAPIVAFQRAVHPVAVHYSRGPMLDMVSAVVEEVTDIHRSKPPGDVLVFLPDIIRIREAYEKLEQLDMPGLVLCLIHDNLPKEFMDHALDPAPGGSRKVVLATDVAETAVLVPGITGPACDGLQGGGNQAGSGGRRRLCGALPPALHGGEYAGFQEHTVPHVKRDGGALNKLALMLKRHAADGMPGFELLDPPVAPSLENVVAELVTSGYLDKHGKLTEKGKREAYDED
ncbi:unnamed protein product [Miscanthus lutarioriparius]|uniref:Uncharacterized protein n=1 Tax=Miscanthus lutarioriparius TaxID=422564 RepID=A0A811MDH4_9POAL|nr:unnamed protein product [Miscanthus lutarioriparius]